MSAVQIGDAVSRKPVTITGLDPQTPVAMRGRVVYVHPKGRFHVVAFETRGGPLRESFQGVE